MVTITGNGAILITTVEIDYQRGIRIDPTDLHQLIQGQLAAGQTEVAGRRKRITIEDWEDE